MPKKLLLLILIFFFTSEIRAQKLSDNAEISVITIGSGTSLNDAFGHNGFRIKDQDLDIDIVFGYGGFDFDAPNFYLNFARGKLNYKITANYYEDFLASYISQNRTVKEQILNLFQAEKQKIFDYLVNNNKPENKYYLYDFFYDNCATKIRDVLPIILNEDINFNEPKGYTQKTFRRLIHDHVDRNSWGGFGIDIALGSVIDKKATAKEHMYLPYYIFEFFESATLKDSKKLVKQSTILYEKSNSSKTSSFITSPLFVFGIIGFLILTITFFDYKNNKRSNWLDTIIFGFTGLVGILILLLWFATDHSATAQNYNLLWAFALNIFMIPQLFKKAVKNWFVKYLKFLVIMLCLLTLHWIIGVQVFAIGLIPILIAFLIRYLYLIKHYQTQNLN